MNMENKTLSMKLMMDCLLKRGYSVRDLGIKPRFLEFTSPEGWNWLTRHGFVSYPFISLAVGQIANNKHRSYSFATAHGVSIPKTLVMPQGAKKLAEFCSLYAPLVVKPLDSFSSKGMELNVKTAKEAEAAIVVARRYSPTVLVQQQFYGSEVRFTMLHGRVVHCLQREAPHVVGDGVRTVAQLIKAENVVRSALDNKLVPYPLLDDTLIPEKLLTDTTILGKGEAVELNKSSLVAGGGVMRNVTAVVDDSYKKIAQELGRALNPAFMVVDMLIADYSKPADASNYVFLEFSIAPSLRLYYDVRSGPDFDIVSKLADMIDAWGKQQ
jgi:D-alanine-D-alanine ligase-like ATP-grasp enzyme